jgi:phosphoglucosamine mutase
MAVVKRMDRPVSEVCRRFEPLPQILRNVRYRSGKPLENPAVSQVIAGATSRLNGNGRVLVRPSGTEPVIRVMAEGDDPVLIEQIVEEIAGAVSASAAG